MVKQIQKAERFLAIVTLVWNNIPIHVLYLKSLSLLLQIRTHSSLEKLNILLIKDCDVIYGFASQYNLVTWVSNYLFIK